MFTSVSLFDSLSVLKDSSGEINGDINEYDFFYW